MPVKELKSMLQTRNISYAGSLATSHTFALLALADVPHKGHHKKADNNVHFKQPFIHSLLPLTPEPYTLPGSTLFGSLSSCRYLAIVCRTLPHIHVRFCLCFTGVTEKPELVQLVWDKCR